MQKTKIEWTDATDNPIRTADGSFYCYKVSEGCDHCYAELVARWIAGMKHATPQPYTKRRPGETPELKLHREVLESWARKTKPKRRFVTSMTDLAGEFVPDAWFFEILDAMAAAPLQTFQILTKRAERMNGLCNAWLTLRGLPELPDNVWPGVTIENDRRYHERMPHLLAIPARHHWLSLEPLVGPVRLDPNELREGITWIVAGGESGNDKKIRPVHPDWIRSLRDQALAAGVPFFFKQWGEYLPACQLESAMPGLVTEHAARQFPSPHNPDKMNTYYKIGKQNAGHLLDGETWHQFPG